MAGHAEQATVRRLYSILRGQIVAAELVGRDEQIQLGAVRELSRFEALQIDRRRVQRLVLVVVADPIAHLVRFETGLSIDGRLLEHLCERIGDGLLAEKRTVPELLGEAVQAERS